ncbi:MAG TPA: transporter substrate-binding domain-containing protein, partial [Firmicutes bacterium]|nr:transporter substrate-binding domain-containing protein [Bacillota bacterium]
EVALDLTWVEAYEKVLAGEIDALPAVGKTTEREQHLLFSEPYYFFKRVIVTQDQDTKISGIEDLHGLTVAVQRNSSHHSYLTYYPQINLSLYDSAETALTAVATQTERVFLGNLATTNYFIRSHALTNLRYVAFEADKEQALHFAVRQDWPELVSVFNKALSLISDDERLAINNRWIGLSTDPDYGPVLRIVAIIGSVVALVLIVSFHWIAVLRREIRKRRQVQQDLERAKQAADEANEFKSTFVARMSHELRTPLNAITGMAYLLKKTNLSLTQRLYVDKITQASSGMMGIIDDILDYSKIEAGRIELDIQSFNLDQVIQNVVNIVLYKIQEQEIGFRLAKDPQIPTWFFGDSKRLEQILLNLLNNAAKFTSEGEVSLDIRLLAREKDTYHLTFTIKDTGIGMDEEQMHKLFDPFIQGDSSISRRFGGSGLGLSIAKHLLDLMGGTIQVFSTEHEGSTFIIDLPLVVDLNQEGNYIQALSGDPFKDVRTLVLERSGANMNVIESYLRSFGMRCELTTSPASAIRMLEAADGTFAKPFDLLIVDYETPEKGGFDFVDAIDQNVNIVQKPECIMLLPMMRVDLFDELSKHKIALGIGKPIIPSVLLNGILDIFNVRAVGATRVLEKAEDELVPLERH